MKNANFAVCVMLVALLGVQVSAQAWEFPAKRDAADKILAVLHEFAQRNRLADEQFRKVAAVRKADPFTDGAVRSMDPFTGGAAKQIDPFTDGAMAKRHLDRDSRRDYEPLQRFA
ncbi:hypothetical protein [Cupriavidus basilensis]|uniref:hypothetical protein n=1 Tax=Cupriavidus basilensis TaxID=68895 RepID=UPI0023E8EFF5|nr:hypothetical protein [Cupriavidus basilensis]MDF3887557.1 hypothetical protein [Cupriavidus basilensis]